MCEAPEGRKNDRLDVTNPKPLSPLRGFTHFVARLPMAHAVGYILPPPRGSPFSCRQLANCRLPTAHCSLPQGQLTTLPNASTARDVKLDINHTVGRVTVYCKRSFVVWSA